MHATPDIKYKLDLHGERREKAIQKLISFLDQIRHEHKKKTTNTVVNTVVVTGSGSHSMEGPILRTAIEKVLKKRQMTYHLTHKRGAFVIDALSGIELSFDEQGRDSKLILLDDHDDFTRLHNSTKKSKSNAVPPKLSLSHNNTTKHDQNHNTKLSQIIGDDNPSPSEVATFDNHLKKAKELSLKDVAKEQSKKGKESNDIHKAMELSIKDQQERTEKEMMEMEKMIADAIELSKQSVEGERSYLVDEDDEELRRVLELSANEVPSLSSNNDQLEQDALEYAIMISEKEDGELQGSHLTMDEEERLLQMALKMSKVEYHKTDVLR